ncbi:hypothetical protein SacmaDRAFT_2322 [Saccharomonospora marina XMU15]|uniref:Uncharacterized protein n=2 Tax=Saccharomonospora TaxID=1851 RepID=H5WWL7_9PSEU|nr:hypothetical protein SacmaDRAFT_2322 [Saccharomonospora marina XMU15]
MLMLTVTPPLAVDDDQIWVLVASDAGAVDAARMAHIPGSDTFVAFPVEAFDTGGVLPTYRVNGECVTGFRWATTTDLAAHADLFTN